MDDERKNIKMRSDFMDNTHNNMGSWFTGICEYFLPSPVETITGVRELILNGTLW